jgi:hypothetical protein
MLKKLYLLSIMMMVIVGASAWPAPAWGQSDLSFFLTGPAHVDNFPLVEVDLRVVNGSNQAVNNLTNSSLALFENGKPVKDFHLQAKQDGALQIIYVVDLSQYSNQQLAILGLADLQAAFTTLVTGGYFVDGRDTVQVLKRVNSTADQTVEVLPPTQKGVDLTKWAQTFDFKGGVGPTKGLLGVDDAIKKAATANGARTTAVIYVGYRIDDPPSTVLVNAATGEAQKAKDGHVLVYAFHSAPQSGGWYGDAALTALATSSGGTYLHLQRGSVGTAVAGVYGGLNAMRTVYGLTYRSTLASSGPRLVAVAPAGAAADSPQAASTSYNVTIQSPVAAITAPADGTVIQREVGSNSQTVRVTAKVSSWPDNHPRNVQSAQLIVNGLTVQTLNQPDKDGVFNFEWNISGINGPGTNATQIEVRLVDELGEEATATATVNVEVPAQATSPAGTQTSFCVQHPTDPSCQQPTPAPQSPTWVWVVAGILLLLILVAAAVVVLLIVRQLRKAPEAPAAAPVREVSAETIMVDAGRGQPTALAQLKITQGPPGMAGTVVNLVRTTTVLGRAPQMADVVFYADEEHSVVSRRHCSLQSDGTSFTITDHSANGTSVNGQRLARDVPTALEDGDDVTLGTPSDALGVRFTFSLLVGKTQLWSSSALAGGGMQEGATVLTPSAGPAPGAARAAAAPKAARQTTRWLIIGGVALAFLLLLACLIVLVAYFVFASGGRIPGASMLPTGAEPAVLATIGRAAAAAFALV